MKRTCRLQPRSTSTLISFPLRAVLLTALLIAGLWAPARAASPQDLSSQNLSSRDLLAQEGASLEDAGTSGETSAEAAPPAATAEASMSFAVAKLLADEGSFREALEAFEQTVSLAPKDPYVRAAYTELLVRLAQLSRSPRYRQQQLQRAVEQAQAARGLAPEDPDVLQVVGQTFLTVAEVDPQNVAALQTAREIFQQVRELSPDDITVRMTLGQILLYLGNTDEAIEAFREAVTVSPGNRRAYGFLVEALRNSGRNEEVEKVYRDVLDFDPTAEEALLGLAELQGARGDHLGAVETLRAAPPELLATEQVRQTLAVQLFLSGDLRGSLTELDGAIADHGENASLGRLRALVLNAQGRNQEAAQQLWRLLAENPKDPEVALTLARVLVRMERGDEAAQVLGEVVARLEAEAVDDSAAETPANGAAPNGAVPGGAAPRASNAAGLRLEWAELLLEQQQWQAALDVLEPLHQAEVPQLRLGAELLSAEALVRLERGDEALELLSRSSSKDPAAVAKRAELLLRLERPEEARKLLDGLAGSGDEISLLAAALVYQRLEHYDEVVRLVRGYLEDHEATPRTLFLLASALERQGSFDHAVSEFRRLLKMDPDNPDALNYLGYMWAERGENLQEALQMISRAVAQEPDSGAFVDSLGWVYFQLGRYQEALEHLERAAHLVTDDGTVLEHLGDAYRALGRWEEAREAYGRALRTEDGEQERIVDKLRQLDAQEEADGAEP